MGFEFFDCPALAYLSMVDPQKVQRVQLVHVALEGGPARRFSIEFSGNYGELARPFVFVASGVALAVPAKDWADVAIQDTCFEFTDLRPRGGRPSMWPYGEVPSDE